MEINIRAFVSLFYASKDVHIGEFIEFKVHLTDDENGTIEHLHKMYENWETSIVIEAKAFKLYEKMRDEGKDEIRRIGQIA